MSDNPTNNDPADADEVLQHVTVGDVETLHGMVLTEADVEQIKDRLGKALTEAINEIRGIERTWTFIGHWANDRIVVEWVEEGEVEDHREDTGQYPEGLWAASGSGPDIKTAQAAVIAEYEADLAEQSKP